MKIRFFKDMVEETLTDKFAYRHIYGRGDVHFDYKLSYIDDGIRITLIEDDDRLFDKIELSRFEIANIILSKHETFSELLGEASFTYEIVNCKFTKKFFIVDCAIELIDCRKPIVKNIGGGTTKITKNFYGPQVGKKKRFHKPSRKRRY